MFPGWLTDGRGYRERVNRPAGPIAKTAIAAVEKAVKSKAWAEALEKNGWTPAWLGGDAFGNFVDEEFASLRATMVKSGMV